MLYHFWPLGHSSPSPILNGMGTNEDVEELGEAAKSWLTHREPVHSIIATKKQGGIRREADGDGENARWLEKIRDEMLQSKQWQGLTRLVYSEMQKDLEKSHTHFFADLSEDERVLMINGIENYVSESPVFRSFDNLLNETLERQILQLVEKRRRDGNQQDSKSSLIMDIAAQGMTTMLSMIPSSIPAVRLLLNQKIPMNLRKQLWDMFLRDSDAAEAYRTRVHIGRIGTISSSDVEVTERCQEIFENELISLSDSGNHIMLSKTVLSYRESRFGRVPDPHFYLVVPLVLVFAKNSHDLTRVVEAMEALLSLEIPRVPLERSARFAQSEELCRILSGRDRELFVHLQKLAAKESEEMTNPNIMILSLVEKHIDHLFVGVVDVDTTLYIWDQCLLAGFNELVLPFAVAIMVLLRTPLLSKQRFGAAKELLQQQSSSISISSLSIEMEENYLRTVRDHLGTSLRDLSHWNDEPIEYISISEEEESLRSIILLGIQEMQRLKN